LGGGVALALAVLKLVANRKDARAIMRDKLAEVELHDTETAMAAVDRVGTDAERVPPAARHE